MLPVKNLLMTTSYGGIIRIRLKGRSWMTSSQPASTSSPVFCSIYYMLVNQKIQELFRKRYSGGNTTFSPLQNP